LKLNVKVVVEADFHIWSDPHLKISFT